MVHSITLKKILSAIMIIILVASLFSLSACKKKEPERGEQGIQGEKGDAGEKGENGSTPYIGTNGNWWIDAFDTGVLAAGKDGTNGANGLPGINGKDGVTPGFKFEESEKILYVSYDSGATWQPMIDLTGLCINGVDGKDGLPGTDGKDGINGTDGKDGVDGKDGENGVTPLLKISASDNLWMVSYDNGLTWKSLGVVATGKDGVDGINGTDGKDGKDGENGKNGVDGKDGADGANGEDGVTPLLKIDESYMWQVSYDNGKTWETLGKSIGMPGANGTDGKNGQDGKDGENGKDGISPILQFEDNKIYVSYDKGLTYSILFDMSSITTGGSAGADGKDGITPKISIDGDGYWQVSYDNGATWESLGVSAVGKDGENGTDGSAGTSGSDGADGKDGVTPKIKIEENVWMVSYDNGASWESLGVNASGSDGNDGRGISSMEIKDGYLYVTYTDSQIPVKVGAVGTSSGSGGSTPEDSDYYSDGLAFYPLPDGTYGVKMGYTEYLEEIIIPAKYKGKAVTKILDGAFREHEYLKSISLPESITEIGELAFYGCENLSSITIPSNVTVIGSDAFAGCVSITSLYIPKSVTTIGMSAFDGIGVVECEINEVDKPETWDEFLGYTEIKWGIEP